MTLEQPMGDDYRVACWMAGATMIAVAIIASIVSARRRPAAGGTSGDSADAAATDRFRESGS